MKSLTKIVLAAILLTVTGYSFATIHPTVKERVNNIQDRHLSGFNAVSLAGSFDVYIVQGSTESVKVEAPNDVISHIITEVQGGVLKIYSKHDSGFSWGNMWGHKKTAIYVSVKDVNSISVTGSGDMFFKDGIRTNSLKLKVSGSGDMLGKVNVKNLESSVSGSGNIKISGRADNSTVSVVGSGDFTGRGLVTLNTAVRVTGSGDAEVNANNKIDASVVGSGDIHYTGAAKNVSQSKAGSGDINRL